MDHRRRYRENETGPGAAAAGPQNGQAILSGTDTGLFKAFYSSGHHGTAESVAEQEADGHVHSRYCICLYDHSDSGIHELLI